MYELHFPSLIADWKRSYDAAISASCSIVNIMGGGIGLRGAPGQRIKRGTLVGVRCVSFVVVVVADILSVVRYFIMIKFNFLVLV